MHGHDTSPMGTVPGNSPFLLWGPISKSMTTASMLRSRDSQCTPHCAAGKLYPGFPTALPSGLPCWDPSQRGAHMGSWQVAFLPPRLWGKAQCRSSALTQCLPRVSCRIWALSCLSIWKQTLAKSYMLLFKVSQFVFILLATFTSCSELCLKLKGTGNVQQEKIIHW